MKHKHYIGLTCLFLSLLFSVTNQAQTKSWKVLKTYDNEHTQLISMPIGGIGTGTISLNGRGGLQDWEIMNRPARGYNPAVGKFNERSPFFAINIQSEGKSQFRLLEGPTRKQDFEGNNGSRMLNAGFPRFSSSNFETSYPFGRVNLIDSDLPVEVGMEVFNPIIPGNVNDSSIPMMVLTYTVKNTSNKDIEVSISGNIPNFIGFDGFKGRAIKNKNEFKKGGNFEGLLLKSKGVKEKSEQWGTMALVSLGEGTKSYRTTWNRNRWGSSTVDFLNDFEDGVLEDRTDEDQDMPIASIANKEKLAAGETKTFRFLISWHFPNRQDWCGEWGECFNKPIGNYYTTQYTDAWDVVTKSVPKLEKLESESVNFVNSFLESDIPEIVKESALFNLSSLRTQLVFRDKDGFTFGWEGNFEQTGACFGSCTHVWNYEQTMAFLFGELSKSMRTVEFGYATDDKGLMSFRVYLPLKENAQVFGKAAADGQMGSIMQFYREWQLSGDDEFLKELWPKVKKALEFSWIEGGWDANKDGVMEGSQHNTMDVEYFGPNPQMGFWYLGALKASAEMAEHLGDKAFAKQCNTLYNKGSKWMDSNLFNGEYYEHHIVPPMKRENVAPSLLMDLGADDFTKPDYQLGKGVLVDQLVGQLMSHIVGLGYLAEEGNIKKTLKSIMKYNYRETLKDNINVMRTYSMADESALLMASYPGEKPMYPFPYFTEVMTGFEYTAAIGMIYEGQVEDGLKCMENIRNRYDGVKRNPYDEAEYGSHYARAMVAWGGVLATSDFNFSAVEKSMSFTHKNGTYFWSNGYQYGSVTISDSGNNKKVALTLYNGELTLNSFELKGFGELKFKKGKKMNTYNTVEFIVSK